MLTDFDARLVINTWPVVGHHYRRQPPSRRKELIMGLDIYLYSKEQQEANDAHEKAYEAYYEEWGEKPDSPEKAAAKEAIPPYASSSDPKSVKYPDHLFNRRYLRSSYNSGGFDRAVPDIVGEDHTLYWIFDPVIQGRDEPYETVMTEEYITLLEQARERALQVAEEIREADPLRAESVTTMLGAAKHMWQTPPTPDEVLEWYRQEKEEHKGKKNPWGDDHDFSYSNAKGTIFGFKEGSPVLAAAVGRDFFGGPSAILVYRMSEDTKDSYISSAEIVAEFCEEAIMMIKQDGVAYMHWSG